MVIEDFASKSVFLDTAPLIYFIEGKSIHQHLLNRIFQFNDMGGFLFITSSVTLLEVLVKPIKEGQPEVAKQYRDILTRASGIEIVAITNEIAERAAQLRAKYNVKTPDAIQVATSIQHGAVFFLTNDNRLKIITEIKVITLGDLS